MIPKWVHETHPVQDGERVDQGVTSRHPLELEQRTNYLKALYEILERGSIVISQDLPMSADVAVGHAVFWDTTNQRCERALAAVDPDPQGGYLVLAESAYVIGIVVNKTSDTLGDVVMFGYLEGFAGFEAAVGGEIVPGPYYLSAAVPGSYTMQSPPISVYIGFLTGSGNGFIQPAPRDFLESHVHYRFELSTDQALSSDDPGWLPAGDPSFGGLAPAEAVYGYNISQDVDLQKCFPPVPPQNASVTRYWALDPGSRMAVGCELLTSGACPLVIIDANGIWWTSDALGEEPWYFEGSSPGLCKRMSLVLWFTRMVYKTDRSVVTSLGTAAGSPVKFKDSGGNPAVRGDLLAYLDLSFSEGDAVETMRAFAYKEISGVLFKKGPVVSAIRSDSEAITVSSANSVNVGGSTYRHGTVVLDFTLDSAAERELFPQLFGLNNVLQQNYNGILYLGMPAGRTSSFRLKLHLPSATPASPKLRIEVEAIARSAGTLPDLGASYRRAAQPVGCTSQSLPAADTDIPGGIELSACGALGANAYISSWTAQFDVAPGDTVFATVLRSGGTDGYLGEVGILKVRCRLLAGS